MEEKYRVDYTTGEVRELVPEEIGGGYQYRFIGNLNGKTLEKFLLKRESMDEEGNT